MGLDSGLNAKVTKTELDEVLEASYSEPDARWGFGHADNPLIFRQMNRAEGDSYIVAEHMGPGLFEEIGENETPPEVSSRTENKMTVSMKDWALDIPISRNFYADDKHDVVNMDTAKAGRKARDTQDKKAMDLYAGGFDTHKTPDGNYIWYDSHTNLNGDTIDTLETGALTVTNLEILVRKLYTQKDQNGDLGSHGPGALLVPNELMKKALVYTESELLPGSGDNDRNYISLRFNNLQVIESPWLGATYHSQTYAATSYFLVAREHMMTRWIREGLNTVMVPWQNDKQRRWMYRPSYREAYFCATWEGAVASNGSA